MNGYHGSQTTNRNRIQQLEPRATLLATLHFKPSGGFERLFRRRVVALETDFVVRRPSVPSPSRSRAA